MNARGILLFLLAGALVAADKQCLCDPSRPETMTARECSLCAEAERHPPDVPYFFLKDNNPRKPNRWLILPRKHYPDHHSIDELPRKEYDALWEAAIRKAKELFGEEWGLAYNGDAVRTQCHGHIHIGRWIRATEAGKPLVISKVSQIPRSRGKGMWIHGIPGGKMHVHYGEQICETALVR
jgi:diadenosine tetraphosphate (Ap4A) HIT family hydrolase